jgi:Na+-translocating ferredoxin:NAD+ oxidoreductase RNF subunit RnfB
MLIYAPVIILGTLGIIFGAVLAYASKIFAVKVDPRTEKIAEILPGANCGACGAPGCFGYAQAIVSGKFDINLCTPGGKETSTKIAKIMGTEAKEMVKMKAVVQCKGGKNEAKQIFSYIGIENCTAAELLAGGGKACVYGCLGLGSCVDVCPFNAMYMNENNLPVVIDELCTGCGLCVKACPRNIMKLIPVTQKIYLACMSKDKGKDVKDVCSVGCTGCSLCANPKVTPSGDIVMDGNLPVVNFTKNVNLVAAVYKCPTDSYVLEIKFAPLHINEKCDKCSNQPSALCVKMCPVKNCITINEEKNIYQINNDTCIGCQLCKSVCPQSAVELTVEVEAVV